MITKKDLKYAGSIGIDKKLMDEGDLLPGEKVQVLNFDNGSRFETYVIEEKEGSGIIALYGPAARLGEVGDRICVISYILIDTANAVKLREKIVIVNEENKSEQN